MAYIYLDLLLFSSLSEDFLHYPELIHPREGGGGEGRGRGTSMLDCMLD